MRAPIVQRVCSECEEELQRQPMEEVEDEEENALQMKPLAFQITPLIQRQAESFEEEDEETVQTKLITMQISPLVQRREQVLQSKPLVNRISPLVQRMGESTEEDDEKSLQTKPLTCQFSPLIQRMSEPTEEEKEEEEQTIRAKENPGQIPSVTSSLEARLNTSKGSGQPLPKQTRSFMESRFGHDFSQVRVHADSESGDLNRQLKAQAFTKGQNVFFGAGKYRPESGEGKRLLAHELTHVLQQNSDSLIRPLNDYQEANEMSDEKLQIRSLNKISIMSSKQNSLLLQRQAKQNTKAAKRRHQIATQFKTFGKTQDYTQEICNKSNVTDDEIISLINKIIDNFPDPKLKDQIGSSLNNRKNFLIGMTPYLGSLTNVIEHFSKIEKVEVPGDVHLHQSAKVRLEQVAKAMENFNLPMPSTNVALGLRGRYRPHMRTSKGYNAHPMGYAVDYRAYPNPKITDKRTVALIQIQTGEANNFVFKDEKNRKMSKKKRRELLREIGKAMYHKTIDPKATILEETKAKAKHFLNQFEKEYYRVSQASKQFVTDISPYVAEARDVWMTLRNKDKKIRKITKSIEKKERKLRRAESALKKRIEALAKEEQNLISLKKQILDLQGEITKLTDQNKDVPRASARTLAKLEKKAARIPQKIDRAKKRQEQAQKNRDKIEKDIEGLKTKIKEIEDAETRIKELKKDLPKLAKPWLENVQKEIKRIKKRSANYQFSDSIKTYTGTELLDESSKELKVIYKKLKLNKNRKEVKKLESEWNKFKATWKWYNEFVKPLEHSLLNDPDFVLGEVKKVGKSERKPLMYIIGYGGFFTPDKDEELISKAINERPDPTKMNLYKHGFNLRFMQVMALYGFDQGISWNPTGVDAMHFELVEGVDSILEKPKSKSKKK